MKTYPTLKQAARDIGVLLTLVSLLWWWFK